MKKYLPLMFNIAISCFSIVGIINIARGDYIAIVGNLISIILLIWAKKYIIKK